MCVAAHTVEIFAYKLFSRVKVGHLQYETNNKNTFQYKKNYA